MSYSKEQKHILEMLEDGPHTRKAIEHNPPEGSTVADMWIALAMLIRVRKVHVYSEGVLRGLITTGAEALKQAECKWEENDPNGPMPQTWEADCGLCWYLEEGRPSDNNMTCCPACGNELVDVKFEEDES